MLEVPQRDISDWAREMIDQCFASRKSRVAQCAMFKSYYLAGSNQASPATYNKIFSHVDRLAAYLYSPISVRFDIQFDKTRDEHSGKMADLAASVLTRDFH